MGQNPPQGVGQKTTTEFAIVDRYALQREIRQTTIDQLHYAIATFAKYLGREPNASDFCDTTVNRWILWMAREGYAVETIRTRRRGLMTLWRSEAEEGRAVDPKKVRRVAPVETIVRAWTEEQVQAILEECRRLPGTFPGSTIRRALYCECFSLTKYETGFRRGDMLRIRRPQITAKGLIPLVQGKTGRVHIGRIRLSTLAKIDRMGTAGREHVFGDVVSVRRLGRLFDGIFQRAGIEEGSLKWFRRSGATHVEKVSPDQGWRFLGHSSPRVAPKSYIDRMQLGHDPLMPPPLDGRG